MVMMNDSNHGLTRGQKLLFGVSAVALMAPSMTINGAYFWTAPATGLGTVLTTALTGGAIGSVLMAGYLPLAAKNAIKDKAIAAGVVLWLMTAPLVAFNMTNAIGAAASLKDGVVGTRGAAIEVASSLGSELARMEARRAPLAIIAAGRSPAVVEGELQTHRSDLRWNRSRQCTDITLPESKTFCADWGRLNSALGAAKDVQRIDADIDQLTRQKRASTNGATATQATDPQSAAIVRLLSPFVGIAEMAVATAWALLAALAFELMAFMGPFMLSYMIRPRPLAPPPEGSKRRADDPPVDFIPTADVAPGEPLGHYLRPPLTVVSETPPETESPKAAEPGGVGAVKGRKVTKKQPLKVASVEGVVADFLEDRVDTDIKGALLKAGHFSNALKDWCRVNDREVPTGPAIWNQLRALGIEKVDKSNRIYYKGLRLRAASGLRLVKK